MDSPKQDESLLSSPEASQVSSTTFSIPPSNYLTVPSTRPDTSNFTLPGPASFEEDSPDTLSRIFHPHQSSPVPQIHEPIRTTSPHLLHKSTASTASTALQDLPTHIPQSLDPLYMSVYSASSAETESSVYSNPPARLYRVPSFQNMSTSRKISVAEKDQMIQALRAHRVNTLIELRRVERAFAMLGSPDVTEPMTAAWSYYVNSHSLLTELRGLTKNYPFSSECLEEAKRRVYADPQSNRSWNFCWLVLSKIKNDQLIQYYAQYQAAEPAMWGGRTPTTEGMTQLTNAFVAEWDWALNQMLRHWDAPPTR